MSSTAAATSSASPTTSTASPSSAFTPARKTAWSSTRKRRGRPAGAPVPTHPHRHQASGSWRGMDSSTSAPWPGAERMTAEPPERAMRARMDWAMP